MIRTSILTSKVFTYRTPRSFVCDTDYLSKLALVALFSVDVHVQYQFLRIEDNPQKLKPAKVSNYMVVFSRITNVFLEKNQIATIELRTEKFFFRSKIST